MSSTTASPGTGLSLPGQKKNSLRIKNLLFKLPLVGDIAGRYFSPALRIENTRLFGRSFSMPTVLEILIDAHADSPGHIGRLVKERFFPSDNPIYFNVSFSCGRSGLFEQGKYTDPLSHWFNVFFGYYQIDVVIDGRGNSPGWKRPFGYTDASRTGIEFQDLVRIAKADWNYFSNLMYGVPLESVRACDGIDMKKIKTRVLPREEIRNRRGVRTLYDCAEVDGLEVVSAYASSAGIARIENPSPLSPVWRLCYGNPHPREGFPRDFMPCLMKARFFMRSFESRIAETEEECFTTLIFGGTVNRSFDTDPERTRFNELFLDEQMDAARRVMKKYF